MPDLYVLIIAAGAALVLAGIVLLTVGVRRGRQTSGALGDLDWVVELPEPDPALAHAETALIPTVQPELEADAPTELIHAARPGRHSYAGQAADTGHVPEHDVDTIGWRIQPAGWTPPIGAARIAAALDVTQQQSRVIQP